MIVRTSRKSDIPVEVQKKWSKTDVNVFTSFKMPVMVTKLVECKHISKENLELYLDTTPIEIQLGNVYSIDRKLKMKKVYAKTHDIEWDDRITYQQQAFLSIVGLSQKCPLTGEPIQYTTIGEPGSGFANGASYDRIFPEVGYVPGNIVITSIQGNQAKNAHSIITWLDNFNYPMERYINLKSAIFTRPTQKELDAFNKDLLLVEVKKVNPKFKLKDILEHKSSR